MEAYDPAPPQACAVLPGQLNEHSFADSRVLSKLAGSTKSIERAYYLRAEGGLFPHYLHVRNVTHKDGITNPALSICEKLAELISFPRNNLRYSVPANM